MGKSTRLTLGDVEGALSLVHECRDLWADPSAWRGHLLSGLCRLTGQAVGHYVEVDPATLDGGPVRFLAAADSGWRDEAARSFFVRYASDIASGCAVPFPGMDRLFGMLASDGRAIAFRDQVCSNSDWYGSSMLNEYRRPAFNDGFVISFIHDPRTGVCSQLAVHQDTQDSPPTLHARRLVELVHTRIAPLIGKVLSGQRQRSRFGLTPRLNQVLDCLLAGDSQKEIAARLQIRLPTAHEHVAKIYRHFDVSSHAELLAYFLARRPKSIR